jgi:hypothetical protein
LQGTDSANPIGFALSSFCIENPEALFFQGALPGAQTEIVADFSTSIP